MCAECCADRGQRVALYICLDIIASREMCSERCAERGQCVALQICPDIIANRETCRTCSLAKWRAVEGRYFPGEANV